LAGLENFFPAPLFLGSAWYLTGSPSATQMALTRALSSWSNPWEVLGVLAGREENFFPVLPEVAGMAMPPSIM
jgi:hypothetical protein